MNILLITADQWRGDAIGYAGNPVIRTPHLDALAAEGVAFRNHYAQAAPCSPARAGLYTGLYQMNHRVCVNGSPLAHRFDNIARAARRAGYDPTLFGYTDVSPDPTVLHPGDPDLLSYEGVLPGFTTRLKLPEHERPWISWLRQQGLDLVDHDHAHLPVGVPPGTVSAAPARYDHTQTQTAFLVDEFARWHGEQTGERPWFAHLSFIRPHPPFINAEMFSRMFDPNAVPGFIRAASPEAEANHPLLDFALRFTERHHFIPMAEGLVKDLTEAEFRQIKATYYGMIAEVDAQLGRAFDLLRARNDWENTLVIFTSDHAEMMGDHFALGKGGYFDQSQHIPLIIRGPGVTAGRIVEAFTESIDIFPTLTERLGVAPLHEPDGRSLSPWLTNENPADWCDALHWEFDFRDIAGQGAGAWFGLPSTRLNLAVIRTERWKYVHFSGLPPLLFDLAADPGNLINLAEDPAHAGTRLMMAEKLLAWRAEHLDQTLALRELTPQGVISRPRRA